MHDQLEKFRIQSAAVEAIRRFFAKRAVKQILSPCITEFGVSDPHLESVALIQSSACRSRTGQLFLRTSPEYFHKRMLSAGCGDIYELGPAFRAGEHGRHHRTEFLMLEWYRLDWDWRRLAEEVVELIQSMSPVRTWKTEFRSWLSISQQHLGFDASQASIHQLQASLSAVIDQSPADLDHSQLLDWWFATQVQPHFSMDTLTVVFDYPAAQAALARLCPDRPNWAERFEVFAGPLELANGYRELTDAAEQKRRFKADNQLRKDLGLPAMPIDSDFMAAIEHGLPECSGVAMGFERLLMAVYGYESIDQISLS